MAGVLRRLDSIPTQIQWNKIINFLKVPYFLAEFYVIILATKNKLINLYMCCMKSKTTTLKNFVR